MGVSIKLGMCILLGGVWLRILCNVTIWITICGGIICSSSASLIANCRTNIVATWFPID